MNIPRTFRRRLSDEQRLAARKRKAQRIMTARAINAKLIPEHIRAAGWKSIWKWAKLNLVITQEMYAGERGSSLGAEYLPIVVRE